MSKKESRCDSCGKPYVEHLGLIGTCFHLQGCRAMLRDVLDYLDQDWNSRHLDLAKRIKNVLDRTK